MQRAEQSQHIDIIGLQSAMYRRCQMVHIGKRTDRRTQRNIEALAETEQASR